MDRTAGNRRRKGVPVEQRTRLSAEERRSQLVDVAGRLFAAHGFHGLSMEQLAEAAGVSKPVLYQHFPSKRDLYLALVRDAVTEMEAQVRKALAGTRDNRARLEGAIAAYFDFVEDRRFTLLFGTAQVTDPDVRAAVEGAMAGVADAVGALIAEDAGLSPQSAEFLANALRGLAADGAQWWLSHPEVDKAEAVRLLSRLAWRGLGSFPEQD
jgi:AcrR family transcriptional regulator